jgi:hypothetical protein
MVDAQGCRAEGLLNERFQSLEVLWPGRIRRLNLERGLRECALPNTLNYGWIVFII